MVKVDELSIPRKTKISGRKTTLTAAFANALLPRKEMGNSEKRTVLRALEIDPDNVKCAYCGDQASEWDHLRPIISGKRPTGWITEAANLVPACGKCNQSKGKKPWKDWMQGGARNSPASRNIPDLKRRIELLDRFIASFPETRVDLSPIEDTPHWKNLWKKRDEIFRLIDEADTIASAMREETLLQ